LTKLVCVVCGEWLIEIAKEDLYWPEFPVPICSYCCGGDLD